MDKASFYPVVRVNSNNEIYITDTTLNTLYIEVHTHGQFLRRFFPLPSRSSSVLDRPEALAMEGVHDNRSCGSLLRPGSHHKWMLCGHSLDHMVQEQVVDAGQSHAHQKL